MITKVQQPTEWVSRMVANVKKNGDLRICIDPLHLNKVLNREPHLLPVIDDVLPEITGAHVFSKFDLHSGYWHCTLDEESSLLTTFQTPNRRYWWLRLPFGLCTSREIIQKRLHQALEGLENVICIADDIIVYGKIETQNQSMGDHDKHLKCFLQRCREVGMRLNGEKTILHTPETGFLGHRVICEGLSADPGKTEAIVKLKTPTSVLEVQRLGGMVNYLARYLPRLSEVMMPVRKLTRKNIEWSC